MLASCNLFFPRPGADDGHLRLVLVYLTPVIYDQSMYPARFEWMKYANPMAPDNHLLARDVPARDGAADGAGGRVRLGGAGFGVGWWVYRSLQWRFAEMSDDAAISFRDVSKRYPVSRVAGAG